MGTASTAGGILGAGDASTVASYATASATWYDALGRTVATADYGREDAASPYDHDGFFDTTSWLPKLDADGVPSVAEAAPLEPSPSNTDYIVTQTVYDPDPTQPLGAVTDSIDNAGNITRTITDEAGRTVETIQNYQTGDPASLPSGSLTFSADHDIETQYAYDTAGRMATQTAVDAVGYNVAGEHIPTNLTSSSDPQNTFLVYSPAALVASQNFVVVQYVAGSPGTWQYYNDTAFVPFTPSSSDVLVASISTASGELQITGLSPQLAALNGIQYGYAGGNLTFTFDTDHFTVSTGYFATTSDEFTEYLYGCPYNASLQTAVIDPGSTAALSWNSTTEDWTINSRDPFLNLPEGDSFMAPTLGPSDNGDFTISMPSPDTYYLLGNSSSSPLTLDASEFPGRSQVMIWNGSSFNTYTAHSNSWFGGTPTVGVNQAFFVLPYAACTLTIPGVTGSPSDYSYSLQDATLTPDAGGTTVSFNSHQSLLKIEGWNPSSQSYEELSGSADITSWTGYSFDAKQALTVTFGDGSVADYTSTTYDRLGRTLTTTDPRGVTHTYSYADNGTNGAGQVTLDSATIPQGVDTTVRSIGTTYDDMGRVQTVTSYQGVGGPGSTIVNQVFDAYLCPCQLGAVKIFRLAAGRPSPGVGRSSLAHSSMAA